MTQDFLLDRITHDLIIHQYALPLVSRDAQIIQNVKQRLWHFYKEWFLDITAGTKWFELILIKNYRPSQVKAEIKRRIASTEGIARLTAFEAVFLSERFLRVSYSAITVNGKTIQDNPILSPH
jgi:hypothetical protein